MNRSVSQMLVKDPKLKRNLVLETSPYFVVKKRFPDSVKNSRLFKDLYRNNNTPTKQNFQVSQTKPANSILYLSRRFSSINKPSNAKQIKTIPNKLKAIKKKLVKVNQFVTQTSPIKSEFVQQSLDSLNIIKTLGAIDFRQLKEKRINLPKNPKYEGKKTLIFDLDETLIHCCVNGEQADVFLDIRLTNGQRCEAGINIRPFAQECLKALSKEFEILVFTASHSCYADVVCDYLDPERKLIQARFYRDSCIVCGGILVKDLRIFANRSIKDIIIVDNTIHCVAFQVDNCIPILSWFSDKTDQELLKLTTLLQKYKSVDDIRVLNRKYFNLSKG